MNIYYTMEAGELEGEPALLRFFWDLYWIMDSGNPRSPYWAGVAMTRLSALLDHSDVGDEHLHQVARAMRDLMFADWEKFRHPLEGMEEAQERRLYEKFCARLSKDCDKKIKVSYRTMKPVDRTIVGFNMQQLLRLIDPNEDYTLRMAIDFINSYKCALGPWEKHFAQQQMEIIGDFASRANFYFKHREDYLEIPGDPEESRQRRRRMIVDSRPTC